MDAIDGLIKSEMTNANVFPNCQRFSCAFGPSARIWNFLVLFSFSFSFVVILFVKDVKVIAVLRTGNEKEKKENTFW